MAKAIFDDVLYDTRKSKKICHYYREFSQGGFLTPLKTWSHEIVLYQAKNGVFFEYNASLKRLQSVNEKDAKDTIKKIAPAKYVKMFGGVREASQEEA